MQSLQARTRLGGYGDLSWESLLEAIIITTITAITTTITMIIIIIVIIIITKELRPVSYSYKGQSDTRFGFIAQEVEPPIPLFSLLRM